MQNPHGVKRYLSRTAQFFGILVFAGLLAGMAVNHLHHGDHHHHVLNDTCSTDACHLAIYHPGMEGACDHRAHLIPDLDISCEDCQGIVMRFWLQAAEQVVVSEHIQATNFSEERSVFLQPASTIFSGRGPPPGIS